MRSHIVGAVDESAGDDRVFKALADPTRRALLDALFVADGQSVQALCERHPEMTRFGVMKHLAVLEDAHLVVVRREGRVKRHFLNPVPIQQLSDRWIDKYARPFTRAMTDLQRRLESREGSS
ncbi:MAG: helix-turn-helix transcriptional regulator [Acidimicrobiaceae bacterium]|nr:helix-turn-helix transcriptional regulator [Acidimicrobiaceae bacterium]